MVVFPPCSPRGVPVYLILFVSKFLKRGPLELAPFSSHVALGKSKILREGVLCHTCLEP
jgi:hypothetical protein